MNEVEEPTPLDPSHSEHSSPASVHKRLWGKLKGFTKRHKALITAAIATVLLIGAGAGWFVARTVNDHQLPADYTVMGIRAGGLHVNEARQLMKEQIEAWGNTTVRFVPDRTDVALESLDEHAFTLRALGVTFHTDEAESIFRDWEDGGFWTKLRMKDELEGARLDAAYSINMEHMAYAVADTYGVLVNRTPKDAQVDYSEPLFPVYTPEEDGVELDEHMLHQQLSEAIEEKLLKAQAEFVYLSSAKLSAQQHDTATEGQWDAITLRLPLVTLPPQITVEALQERKPNALLAQYTTPISDAGEGHYHNIQYSAQALDDQVMTPGQSLRYQDIANLVSEQYGLKMAPVIVQGKLVEGVGGGLCQTSSTMYNVALLSGLEIVKRQAHSLPVSYVPLGLDATYSENGPDLIVRNNTDGDIVWETSVQDNKITIRVYGQQEPGVTYEVETKTVKETLPAFIYERKEVPSTLQTHVAQQGKKGYIVETYRIKKKNGYMVSREKMRTSVYRSQPTRMTVGEEQKQEPVNQSMPQL